MITDSIGIPETSFHYSENTKGRGATPRVKYIYKSGLFICVQECRRPTNKIFGVETAKELQGGKHVGAREKKIVSVEVHGETAVRLVLVPAFHF